jgi:hypothetical protein
MAAETAGERQRRLRENMRALGFRRVERWEKPDGSDSREFPDRSKLYLFKALALLLEGVEAHQVEFGEYETARELWRPILGKMEE